MEPFEVVEVESVEVACDGVSGPMGHPRVFLHMQRGARQIQCPYCSRLYVLKAESKAG